MIWNENNNDNHQKKNVSVSFFFALFCFDVSNGSREREKEREREREKKCDCQKKNVRRSCERWSVAHESDGRTEARHWIAAQRLSGEGRISGGNWSVAVTVGGARGGWRPIGAEGRAGQWEGRKWRSMAPAASLPGGDSQKFHISRRCNRNYREK